MCRFFPSTPIGTFILSTAINPPCMEFTKASYVRHLRRCVSVVTILLRRYRLFFSNTWSARSKNQLKHTNTPPAHTHACLFASPHCLFVPRDYAKGTNTSTPRGAWLRLVKDATEISEMKEAILMLEETLRGLQEGEDKMEGGRMGEPERKRAFCGVVFEIKRSSPRKG